MVLKLVNVTVASNWTFSFVKRCFQTGACCARLFAFAGKNADQTAEDGQVFGGLGSITQD